MVKYINFFDRLPFVLKLFFALPILDGIFYGIYRLGKGQIIPGIIWIIFGTCILWVIDVFTICRVGKVTLYANFKS
ncbi:MAG: hypothetical protein PHO86_01505 [Bacilli bacterium]|nr:hypothetical protein [Bacilli bacterium]